MSQMANPYKPGGKNKIIWGDAVAPGSSGPGGVSYNAEMGGLYHILGYENDPTPAAPAPTAAPNVASPKKASSKPAAPKKSVAPSSPRPTSKAPAAASAPVSAGGGSVGGGGGAVASSPSMQALQEPAGGPMGGGGDVGDTNVITAPSSFRQGIGTRMLPNESAAFAALRRLY